MVAPDGSPLVSGWFNESRRKGLPYPTPDNYALTVVPPNARNVHHRIRLTQQVAGDPVRLVEDDFDNYLEGLDDFPTILNKRVLTQPAAGLLIREFVRDSGVLNPDQANAVAALQREVGMKALRAFCREMWLNITDPRFKIDDAFLDECSQL
jgi:hypothetical protein